jgi:hypothetical protein
MTTADDLKTLQELNRHYVRSAGESDVRWYADNLAEDYLSTNPDGSLSDRAAFLERMARPYPNKDPEAVDVRIRVLGDVALIHSGFRGPQARRHDRQGSLHRHLGAPQRALAVRRRALRPLLT